MKALLLAAPSSGSGKTVLTLGLLRALKRKDISVCAAKAGPDYIDPGFHSLACGYASVNLDPWAMGQDRIQSLVNRQQGDHIICEAMMGLFDGAADGSGSAASLAKTINAPVILIVDAAKQSHSIAALVRGFRDHDTDLNFAGVILNKVGSTRHEVMLRNALKAIDVQVLGAVIRDSSLLLPERHLGLVQAGETKEIEAFIENTADIMEQQSDLAAILDIFKDSNFSDKTTSHLAPLGQHISIAQDEAFSFIYPHLLDDWRMQGAEVSFFSPLKDEGPSSDADAIYLPGGYPELHAEQLSANNHFKQALQQAHNVGKLIYGECGGYMVLGDGLVDADGKEHEMVGLLRLETSFAKRKLHLGYRKLNASSFIFGDLLMAHEFHYTSALREEGEPLFQAMDAIGEELCSAGLRNSNTMGSYMHVIDRSST